MKRKSFVRNNLVGAVLLLLLSSTSVLAKIVAGPFLQNPQVNQITVVWLSDDEAKGAVFYGEHLRKKQDARQPQWIVSLKVYRQEAQIKGLSPGQKYLYQVISGSDTSGVFSFNTAPVPGTPITFLAISDAQLKSDLPVTLETIQKLPAPDLIIFSGDLVNNPEIQTDWYGTVRSFFDVFTGETRGAALLQEIPIFPTIGNHEYAERIRTEPNLNEKESLMIYTSLFSLPGNERYYAHDFGNTHFIHLNVVRLWRSKPEINPRWPLGDPIDTGSRQYRWLEDELKRSRSKWKVVSLHHPMFGMGYNAWPPFCVPVKNENGKYVYSKDILYDELRPLLEKYQVDLVIWGHNHVFEHYFLNGVHYIESSCIGNTYGFRKTEAHGLKPVFQNAADRSFTIVNAGKDKMTVTVYRAPDAKIIESFTIEK